MPKRTIVGKPANFGEWLFVALQENKLSQKQLAFDITVAENTIGSWIRNDRKIGITNLVWICIVISKVSGRSYDDLIVEASLFFK
jgi:transcriptional regulator with XRE-family HTH domain